jgi:hypothetical protein
MELLGARSTGRIDHSTSNGRFFTRNRVEWSKIHGFWALNASSGRFFTNRLILTCVNTPLGDKNRPLDAKQAEKRVRIDHSALKTDDFRPLGVEWSILPGVPAPNRVDWSILHAKSRRMVENPRFLGVKCVEWSILHAPILADRREPLSALTIPNHLPHRPQPFPEFGVSALSRAFRRAERRIRR